MKIYTFIWYGAEGVGTRTFATAEQRDHAAWAWLDELWHDREGVGKAARPDRSRPETIEEQFMEITEDKSVNLCMIDTVVEGLSI